MGRSETVGGLREAKLVALEWESGTRAEAAEGARRGWRESAEGSGDENSKLLQIRHLFYFP